MQKNQRSAYPLTVIDAAQVSPSIQRITLQGDAIAHFGKQNEGDYIKLLFSPQGSTQLSDLEEDARPIMRTFTIREFGAQKNSIVVDFVRHMTHDPSSGFAARWAMNAKAGDTISIAGPGQGQSTNPNADWVFLVADMTSLPALAVTLANLDKHTRGYAVIEVNEHEDVQTLEAPQGVKVMWAIAEYGDKLVELVKTQTWLEGQCAVWCACEFDSMKTLRQYFRNDKEIDRDFIYISSYWKNGVSEDGHKVIKRQDAEEQH
ncbi:siderophore-interacting protein [Vibrio sp. Y2-5]|uniref:siderophore-interacting protein n=1 Tax=Vibrio sp. Y2-5 TaxID=2743977 RepID=UPI0016600A75|nr:siderophore-interacting protein [Vibrio sp. Y2-5]MBD0787355.1 siderophore-interacting protein [Vibrio sp. Y2-5]